MFKEVVRAIAPDHTTLALVSWSPPKLIFVGPGVPSALAQSLAVLRGDMTACGVCAMDYVVDLTGSMNGLEIKLT